MSDQAIRSPAAAANSGQLVAFTIHLSRNLFVQVSGVGMVILMGLSVVPWRAVVVWSVAAIAVLAAENHLLRLTTRGRGVARSAPIWGPILRVLATSIYAFAALMLIAKGGPGERLFAFALMSASMVHVLMRYYRSPWVLAASLAPYMVILAIVGWGLVRTAFRAHHWLAALAPIFTIAMFAIQFWSARAQLSGAWRELMGAREAAEERERAAEAASRAKSQFLSNMSHELRTPLNGVLGMVQALSGDQLTPVQRERVSVIRRSSESLLSVLNDLLDLSKIEASVLELEEAEFDLEHLVRGVASAYRPAAQKRGLTFDFEVEDAARGRYVGDSARLRRILHSLADNAVKFTPEGGVRLGVSAANDRLVFRVADTGIGIAPQDLARLFEGFFQADATLARRYGGSGVGLAVSSQLAQLMGGEVEAASVLGEGSVFTLTVPLRSVKASVHTQAAEEDAEPSPQTELRVLAAEDNPTNQLVLKTLLETAGIMPTLVENGRDALAAWEGQAWDIILMDIQMPEMNGIDAAQAIRGREAATGRPRTPIVAVTANAMTHQIAEYEDAGMDGVVAKPIDMASLFNVIERALEKASISDDPGLVMASA